MCSSSQLQMGQLGLAFHSLSHLAQCRVGIVSALTSLCVRHPAFSLSHCQYWRRFLSLYDCCCPLFSWAHLLCPSFPSVSAVCLCLLWFCFLCLTESHPSCPSSCCCSCFLPFNTFLAHPLFASFYFSLAVFFKSHWVYSTL